MDSEVHRAMATEVAAEKGLSIALPASGGSPKVVELAKKDLHPALVFAHDPESRAGETYQIVTDRLLLADSWTPGRIFVTSPSGEDGKTTTAWNLAWALSLRRKRVLLVELVFARPRFWSMLGSLRAPLGIESALHQDSKPEDSIFSIESCGLHVAAMRDPRTKHEVKEYLGFLNNFLDWAGQKYEWLVLDCPSVLSPEWNNWFRSHAAPALLVTRAQQTKLAQVRKSAKLLGQHLKGTLLNDVIESDRFRVVRKISA